MSIGVRSALSTIHLLGTVEMDFFLYVSLSSYTSTRDAICITNIDILYYIVFMNTRAVDNADRAHLQIMT